MADKGIKEGDEVSWNWGGGQPTGVAAEIKTDGKLEIESKGKMVHKNADPDNPAVHVEREGNDVVKRASELTKLSDSGGNQEQEKGREEADEKRDEQEEKLESEQKGVDESNKQKPTPKATGKRKTSDAATKTGEKRAHEDSDEHKEEDQLEEEEKPKPAKKTKTTAKKATRGAGRGRGRGRGRGGKTATHPTEETGDKKEEVSKDQDAKMNVDEGNDTARSEPKEKSAQVSSEGAPAANTRSQE